LLQERSDENKAISYKSIEIIEKLMKKSFEGDKRWRISIDKIKGKFEFFAEKSFKIIDKNNKGFIVIDDMRGFLNSWEFFPTIQEMDLLYSRLDRYNEGIISLRDYVLILDN